MYLIGDVYVRLEHISLLGAVQKIPNKSAFGFQMLVLGAHTHTVLFRTLEEAQKSYLKLLKAIGDIKDEAD